MLFRSDGPSVEPVLDVVGFAVGGWPAAVGDFAALVAQVQGEALGWGDGTDGASQVQRLCFGAEEYGDDFAVAGDAADVGDGDDAGAG